MLYLIGTGISDKGISLEALDICKSCSDLYLDEYTSRVSDSKISFLESATGKRIRKLARSDMEEDSAKLVKDAKDSDIAILVGGDPLLATTHKILFLKAKAAGVKCVILHSASIINSAMGSSGLDFYRFGPIVTVPFWSEHYKPKSFFTTIKDNMERNLHSILLLDYSSKEHRSMGIKEALGILFEAQEAFSLDILKKEQNVIIMGDMGQSSEEKIYISIKDAENYSSKAQSIIIIPAKLTEIESELINSIY